MGLNKQPLPCNFDHNGECLICDCWPSQCAYVRYVNKDYTYETKERLDKLFNMQTITIVIEKIDDFYSAYAENVKGIYGAADTIDEAKKSINRAIKLFRKYNKPENIPEILKGEYQLEYKECF